MTRTRKKSKVHELIILFMMLPLSISAQETVAKDTVTHSQDVVGIGYGQMKKSDVTTAISSLKSEDLKKLSTGDAAAALQGKVAGVEVFDSSVPGSGAKVLIRGLSSNSTDGQGPLFIVDGLRVDNINYLDPSLIESIEVLKDAASAAIYGAQSGNGVILITTKSGRK